MPTLGEQLKQARLDRKISIKQAVQVTRIRAHYIEALEADDLSALPSPAQARGFLRLYADYLNLNTDEIIARLRGGAEPADLSAEDIQPTSAPAPAPVIEAAPAPEPEPDEIIPEPELPPGAPPLSRRIYMEIGDLLRERRELLSLTIEEIERHIHVRQHYLEKIEAGQLDELPSPVQARGMLSSYADFLDMDADGMLLRFAEGLQARRIENQPSQPTNSMPRLRSSAPSFLKRFISPDLIFGGGMVLILLGLSVWGAARLVARNTPATADATEGPSISEILLATPVGGETPTPEALPTSVPELATAAPTSDPALTQATESPTPILEFTPASAVQLTLVVIERTFLRVTVDGVIAQEGRVAPGAALRFDGNERIEVLTGSGAAIQILYNQQDLGVLGNLGEVVDQIYTRNGIQTPTATVSPTPSPTPRETPAPASTSTPNSNKPAVP